MVVQVSADKTSVRVFAHKCEPDRHIATLSFRVKARFSRTEQNANYAMQHRESFALKGRGRTSNDNVQRVVRG
eukprot:94895-Pleurochrysis_carterae.AAC.1